MITKKEKINELLCFYDKDFLEKKDLYNCDEKLKSFFKEHVIKNSKRIKIKDLYTYYENKKILINSPDGFQEIGDFYKKNKRDIFKIKTKNNYSIKCSDNHMIETAEGWKYSADLIKDEKVLTKDGVVEIKSVEKLKKSVVYDFEVLHKNHRYWGGDGISSHNTGKTYLALNGVREFQKAGYSVKFYDSEGAVTKTLVESFGVSTEPEVWDYKLISTIEEFRIDMTNTVQTLIDAKRSGHEIPKMLFILDSAGNLASEKEVADALAGNNKVDMTRAKVLKSVFRILTPKLAEIESTFIFTNHIYRTTDLFSKNVASGGCFLPTEKIIMGDGSLKEIQNVNVDDMVKTLSGSELVTHTYSFEKESYKITFDDGSTISCSEDHRLMDKNGKWLYLKDLEQGDDLLKFNHLL